MEKEKELNLENLSLEDQKFIELFDGLTPEQQEECIASLRTMLENNK